MKFFKQAGILDSPRDILAPGVWTPDLQLYPHAREQILGILYKNIPVEDVKEVFIIGSITGFKYNETSDIDVNVKVGDKPDLYHDTKDTFSGTLLTGTRHPINYFVTEQIFEAPAVAEDWADYKFGVYDVLNDR